MDKTGGIYQMKNLLQIVMTHKDALPTVRRHYNIWRNISKDIILTSPVDSGMEIKDSDDFNQHFIGEAEHNGEKSAQRIIKIFEFALEQRWEYLLLNEYDSFALSLPDDVMPEPGGVSAAKYKQNKPIKFKGKFYLHYPMLFSREGMHRTYTMLDQVKTNDRYFSDRFIGRAVEMAKVPVRNLLKNKRAFSKNTIKPEHYGKLKQAVKDRALFFHGVKNLETLSHIFEIPKIEPIK